MHLSPFVGLPRGKLGAASGKSCGGWEGKAIAAGLWTGWALYCFSRLRRKSLPPARTGIGMGAAVLNNYVFIRCDQSMSKLPPCLAVRACVAHNAPLWCRHGPFDPSWRHNGCAALRQFEHCH